MSLSEVRISCAVASIGNTARNNSAAIFFIESFLFYSIFFKPVIGYKEHDTNLWIARF
jgi:hypothetical protein